ncbi:hypothetical protein A1Q1_02437 [Trichosporon asahii var. asahii CBS 2479]|uniref:Uncharacterized protein n=1 Tax=Trichosporon asahii var. asahii (strain ATCC 90039 / CBS 2479 / JCM 2466 / KCTC 7840 / NBRC 103889/ NCYC 2677 / UAMH 7654) TaxID=1186058 RepID=J6EVC4_TRIAS|nr:hypothetical protein A1Q1_02437 [Trichosporon asahii var. asahii CBS 2479]EJT48529.1 hypothetical protein A1Q1_02437 [Trichosporon asahii var. asahii CBS 2479]
MSTSAPEDDAADAAATAAAEAQAQALAALARTSALAAAAPSIPHESADSTWMELWGQRVGDGMRFAAPVQCVCVQCRSPSAQHDCDFDHHAAEVVRTELSTENKCTSNPLTYDPDLPTLSTGGRYFAFRRGACVECIRVGRGAQCSASTVNSGQVWVFDTLTARWETHLVHGLWYSRKAGVRGRRARRPLSFCCVLTVLGRLAHNQEHAQMQDREEASKLHLLVPANHTRCTRRRVC